MWEFAVIVIAAFGALAVVAAQSTSTCEVVPGERPSNEGEKIDMTEAEALRDIKTLAKIAMRTDDEGQVRVSLQQIEQIVRTARAAAAGRKTSHPKTLRA